MNYERESNLNPSGLSVPVGARDHIQGRAGAPVTLLEYGDFQCPACGEAYPEIKAVRQAMGRQLRFAFRNFPLTNVHPHAEHAAEAAEDAGTHEHFWEMHDLLFEHQDALGDQQLAEYASELGLDARVLIEDLRRGRFAARIREDFLGGVQSGVNGTPTFFINGRMHNGGFDAESLLEALEEATS